MLTFRAKQAFTLIEILVVIVIIATLASAVAYKFMHEPEEARMARAKSDINVLETSLERFRLNMRRYPTEEEGLKALVVAPDSDDADLWKGPYLRRLEKDPWGNPYIYVYPGVFNPQGFDLLTYGADGQEGGEGYNADIGNWSEESPEAE